MTDRHQFVNHTSPTGTGIIDSRPAPAHLDPVRDRAFRRRRLGVLGAASLLVVAVVGALAPTGDERELQVAAADAPVTAAAASSPVLSGVVETTSTLLDPETTTTTVAETTTTTTVAETTTTVAETTTTAAPATTAPPTMAAPVPTEAARATPTTTAPPPTAPPPTTAPSTTEAPSSSSEYSDPDTLQVWLDLAQCESNGNWSINTGNGYYGGLQFSLGTWESVGGTGYPHEHPRDTQIEMGRRLQARAGWDSWPHCAEKLGLI